MIDMIFGAPVESAGKLLNSFAVDQTGATAIEYGLIAGLVSVAAAAIYGTVGDTLTAAMTNVNSKFPG